IIPPTVSNILAVEAPAHGSGIYSREEIRYILRTAWTGFAAVRQESRELTGQTDLGIHTGVWGCGAYGGNRELMGLFQVLSARMAQIHRVVFHVLDPAGAAAFTSARKVAEKLKERPLAEVLTDIQALDFEWGTSDGN